MAKKAIVELDDLDAMRKQVDDVKLTVEAARVTMMTKRSLHDEVRRDGEIQLKRELKRCKRKLVVGLIRLETAEKRMAELIDRRNSSKWELKEASKTPSKIEENRKI